MRPTRRALDGAFVSFCGSALLAVLVCAILFRPAAAQQLKPEEAAAQLLASANKAYDEKQFPFAIERFRQYLKDFGGQKDANPARYGLALALLEGPQKDYKSAIEALAPVVGVQDFPGRATALYYLALAY